MARSEIRQLNIRSHFARERVSALVRTTGMTTTRIIEEALRAYLPPDGVRMGGRLVREGAILVRRAAGGHVSLEDANIALGEARDERG